MEAPVEKEKTKISTVGSLSNNNKISGFTLIELIVVISIISILFSFSFPLFKNITKPYDSEGKAADIVRLINDLKKRAIKLNLDFTMHIDTGLGMIWVTDESMDDEAKEEAEKNGKLLSEDILILNIEFPGIKTSGTEEYKIKFRKLGYSDFALIHIIEHEKNITLKIEPFLSKVQKLNKHVFFEDECI